MGKHAKLQFMLVPNSIFPFFAHPYTNIPMATAPKWHLPLFLLRHLPKGLETVALRTQLGAWWAAAGASTGGDKERGSYLAGVSSDPKNNEYIQKSIELPGQITRNMGKHANLEFPRLPDEGNICKKPWLWLGFDALNMKRGSEMNLFSAGWGLHVQNVPWSRICPAKTDVRT